MTIFPLKLNSQLKEYIQRPFSSIQSQIKGPEDPQFWEREELDTRGLGTCTIEVLDSDLRLNLDQNLENLCFAHGHPHN